MIHLASALTFGIHQQVDPQKQMKWACNHTWEYKKVAEYQCGHTFILCDKDFRAFPRCPIHVAARLKPHSSGRIQHYEYDPDGSTTFFPAEDLEKQR